MGINLAFVFCASFLSSSSSSPSNILLWNLNNDAPQRPDVATNHGCLTTTTCHLQQQAVPQEDDPNSIVYRSVMKNDVQEQKVPVMSRSAFLSASLLAALTTTLPVSASSQPLSQKTSPATISSNALTVSTASTGQQSFEKPQPQQQQQSTLEESISGFVAGAALSVTKTIVKYPLDTATVRIQMPNSRYSIYRPLQLLDGSFRGIATPLLSNIPAGAVFFAVKDATKEFLKANVATSTLPRWASTSLAVLAATFPYMAVRNPSEVIKTRLQAGVEGYEPGVTAWQAFQKVRQGSAASNNNNNNNTSIVGDLYVGYWENVCYTFPADVLKFVCYESLSGGRKNLSPTEGALYGATATAMAQLLTTPLDVVRNRVMATSSSKQSNNNDNGENDSHNSYIGSLKKIATEEGVAGLFAGSSPRVGKAILSGAIQFATYEETKQQLANYFFQKR